MAEDTCGCQFDGWFKSADACQTQLEAQRLVCPACKRNQVAKSLQAPNLSKSKKQTIATPTTSKPSPKPSSPAVMPPEAAEAYKNLYAMTMKMREHVKANCDDVGKDFAKVAREIHYDQDANEYPPKRGIYGQVTEKEAKDLVEEGIEITPLPDLPKTDS